MSARTFAGQRVEWYRAGTTTAACRGCDVRWNGSRNVTGCTANHSMAALNLSAARADVKMGVLLDMTWKSTAVVSGAGLLVTYLANYAPPRAIPAAPARASQAVTVPAVDIQQQADRLKLRVRQEVALSDAARDPFRFAAPPAR